MDVPHMLEIELHAQIRVQGMRPRLEHCLQDVFSSCDFPWSAHGAPKQLGERTTYISGIGYGNPGSDGNYAGDRAPCSDRD